MKSAPLTYTRLSASLKLDGDKLCWTAVDGATGCLLASGEKKASLDASATEANVMSFYSTTKSARVSLVALGDGKTYIDSPQSAEVNCTFTGEYKTLQNVLNSR